MIKCEYDNCNYSTNHKSKMKSHIRQHTGEKPYKCEYIECNYSCANSYSLTIHVRKYHTHEKPYKCKFESCIMEFVSSADLKTHERIHTGEKPYICDFIGCNFKSAASTDLRMHKRIHTGYKPHTCDYEGCSYSCRTSEKLTIHKRIHTGEKPYKCENCEYSATQLPHLKSHRLIHTGEKPYICKFEGCEYSTTQSSHLKTHIDAYHTERGIQKRKKKEEALAKALTSHGIEFKREHQIDIDCFRNDNKHLFSRVDFVIHIKNFIIFLECDEYQHEGYPVSCDVRRMMDVVSSLRIEGNTLPVLWIRFNPDVYKVNHITQNIKKKDRYTELANYIKSIETNTPTNVINVKYMYYDKLSIDSLPIITHESEYDKSFKEFIL